LPVVKEKRQKLFCMSCGNTVDTAAFYSSKNPKYKYWGSVPICRDCMLDIYNNLYQENPDHRIAVIKFCSAMDVPFADNIFDMAMNRFNKDGMPVIRAYFSFINSAVGKKKGTRFQDSEFFDKFFGSGTNEEALKLTNDELDKRLKIAQKEYEDLLGNYKSVLREKELLLKKKDELLSKVDKLGDAKNKAEKAAGELRSNINDDSIEPQDEDERTYSKFWIGDYTNRELEILNNYYESLQVDYKIVTVNHKDYAKKIAKASLAMDTSFDDYLRNGNDSLYKSARDTFDKLSQSAKFAENQRGINDVSLGSYGVMADRIENNTWIPDYEPDDLDMYDKLLAQFANISRSL